MGPPAGWGGIPFGSGPGAGRDRSRLRAAYHQRRLYGHLQNEAEEAARDMETSRDHVDGDLSLPPPRISGAGFQPFVGAVHRLDGSTDPEQMCEQNAEVEAIQAATENVAIELAYRAAWHNPRA